MSSCEYHVPVMADECLNALAVKKDRLYFDGTLGGGSHSYRILKAGGRLLGVDRDSEAIDHSFQRFNAESELNGRYVLVKDNFKNVRQVMKRCGYDKLDGAILDLGISSHQVDDGRRGFSYRYDAVLDMRMDRDQYLSALTVVNEYPRDELAKIIYDYGEEKFGGRIASAVVEERKYGLIETTGQLVRIIERCVPKTQKGGHPAKRTFQAIRIEVNRELDGLKEAVEEIVSLLNSGGRLAVITFHSLEDRIIKQTFATLATDCICDKSFPICVCGHKASVKLGKKLTPTQREIEENPRAKSATLRVAEKL